MCIIYTDNSHTMPRRYGKGKRRLGTSVWALSDWKFVVALGFQLDLGGFSRTGRFFSVVWDLSVLICPH